MNGHSLRFAIDKAFLGKHRTTIYKKIRLEDWFSDKINAFRNLVGELVNESFARMVENIYAKIVRGIQIDHDEFKVLSFMATYHRSSTPFFETGHKSKTLEDIKSLTDPLPIPHIEYLSANQG